MYEFRITPNSPTLHPRHAISSRLAYFIRWLSLVLAVMISYYNVIILSSSSCSRPGLIIIYLITRIRWRRYRTIERRCFRCVKIKHQCWTARVWCKISNRLATVHIVGYECCCYFSLIVVIVQRQLW